LLIQIKGRYTRALDLYPPDLAKAHCIVLGASVRCIRIEKSGTELECNINTSVIFYRRIKCCSFSSCNNKRVQILQVSDLVDQLFTLWYLTRDNLCLCIIYKQPTNKILVWTPQANHSTFAECRPPTLAQLPTGE
jgi:hypothetical protein